jgi:hypothetical protein
VQPLVMDVRKSIAVKENNIDKAGVIPCFFIINLWHI